MEGEDMKQIKHIRTKMFITILPVVVLALIVVTVISTKTCKSDLTKEKQASMEAELNASLNEISDTLHQVDTMIQTTATAVANTYTTSDKEDYEAMLSGLVQSNGNLLGSGLWFEAYVFDKTEQYFGPYAYREGDQIAITYDYSNSDYDYFSQAYYQSVANGTKEAVLTDPYYDETLNTIMASYTMPIYTSDGTFIGAVTADLTLDTINNIAKEIKIGKQGTAMLCTADGSYLSCADDTLVQNGASMIESENTSLAKAAKEILENEKGTTTYYDGSVKYQIYYDTLELNGWKLMIQIPVSELNETVNQLLTTLTIVCVICIVFASLSIILSVNSISKAIKIVRNFAVSLAEGDFTIQPMTRKGADELANMSTSLNDMFFANKRMIGNIAEESVNLKNSSESLNDSTKELVNEFEKIQQLISEVNEAMMSASAATQQVNASTEEVNSSVTLLGTEIKKDNQTAEDIKQRAQEVEAASQQSFQKASMLSREYQSNLEQSIKNTEVVASIGEMADVIAGIADQINLLSLNASIEAARAGEQGRGFAVVANEIGNLAKQTATAVGSIQQTIQQVQDAFSTLTKDSSSMLAFVVDTVTPDYDHFIQIARQYGKDATSIEELITTTAKMTNNIEMIMNEVTQAIQNIAESAQTTADHSQQIVSSIESMHSVVGNVSDLSVKQEQVANDLHNIVQRFHL